ncbi:DUF4192 domain-containing protein [Streptomyces tropicalis]|uniref:DUF4192 domain-containing protein n=1 Tax=Streptomyces tropicalis TaxID=3034234 RepID=A0ABT6A1S0_9ACTN|nr:DUF4192 domain-containing protein [Streptomyces tropicalis]MDF3298326.1 DUF4192 domain-containing protein [Streptomyces tropicalis]
MTNHSETTGSIGNEDNGGDSDKGDNGESGDIAFETYAGPAAEHQVTLRSPAELADALPYLLGYRPEDSIVLVALHDHGGRGRFGGRARLGIPPSGGDWPSAARQLAHGLITGSERRGAKPEQMVAFLCQEPGPGESGHDVRRRLEPLAQKLRTECGRLDVPVIEALCISDGRFWSYCCPNEKCCPAAGLPMGLPGTSVLAAAAAYAGIQVRGSLRELRARLLPWEVSAALEQEVALDTAGTTLVPRILHEESRTAVAEETLALAERVMRRLAEAPRASGTTPADLRDDGLIGHEEAAALILGLQDRTTRDRAAAWMEGDEAAPALRLWRALARRCVGPYGEHAAAPLTLAGWVAWSTGDGVEAREALAMALGADPDYLFARLLHQACNEGLDPESIRRCLRAERRGRQEPGGPTAEAVTAPPPCGDPTEPGPRDLSAAAAGTPSGEPRRPGCGGTRSPVSPQAATRRRRRTRAGRPARELSRGGTHPGKDARAGTSRGDRVHTSGGTRPGTGRAAGPASSRTAGGACAGTAPQDGGSGSGRSGQEPDEGSCAYEGIPV